MVRKIEACGVEKDTMINNLIIRQETEEDYKKTELMIMRSFWNKYCSVHPGQYLFQKLLIIINSVFL